MKIHKTSRFFYFKLQRETIIKISQSSQMVRAKLQVMEEPHSPLSFQLQMTVAEKWMCCRFSNSHTSAMKSQNIDGVKTSVTSAPKPFAYTFVSSSEGSGVGLSWEECKRQQSWPIESLINNIYCISLSLSLCVCVCVSVYVSMYKIGIRCVAGCADRLHTHSDFSFSFLFSF